MRGGVSDIIYDERVKMKFSPRAWRCFQSQMFHGVDSVVFSTCVEVFLPSFFSLDSSGCFLHVRGGVSLVSSRQSVGS